jgi:hypothetical protein
MKRIKISEEQDKEIARLINEMLDTNTSNTNTTNTAGQLTIGLRGGDDEAPLNQNISNTMKTVTQTPGASSLLQKGATMDVEGTVNGKKVEANFQSTNESFLISKQQLDEMRLMKLKEGSNIVKIKNLLK